MKLNTSKLIVSWNETVEDNTGEGVVNVNFGSCNSYVVLLNNWTGQYENQTDQDVANFR